MSCTEMYVVPEAGEIWLYREFRNSWHGAMCLWTHLWHKYLPGEMSLLADHQLLWNLIVDTRLSTGERVLLATTFDHAMVRREELEIVASAIDEVTKSPNMNGHWGSWPAQAEALRELVQRHDCFAVCWNQTSVNSDFWWIDDGKDGRLYDIAQDTGHWFVFDEVSKYESETTR